MLRSGSLASVVVFAVTSFIYACDSGSTSDPGNEAGSGGTATGSGGSSNGGSTTGGTTAGGSSSGGSTNGGSTNGGSGGAVSTGGSDTSSSGGASAGTSGTDACAKAIYCDDFEKYTPGKAPDGVFKTRVNSGTVSVDETQHASGARSVKFTTDAKDGTKTAFLRLEGGAIFPVTGNVYYGRMMFRLEAAPTTSVHWTLIQSGGTIAGQSYHALYRYGGQQPVTQANTFVGSQLMANYDTPDSYSGTGPKSDCWFHSNRRVVPVGKWTCIEWKFDGPANQMRLWMDGAPLEDLSVNGVGQGCVNQPAAYPWTAPNFENVELGWESYQNDAARTLYVDDLVISREPIGCPG